MLFKFTELPGGLGRFEIYCENKEELEQFQAVFPPLGKAVTHVVDWKDRTVTVESRLTDAGLAKELAAASDSTPKGATDYTRMTVPRLREFAAERHIKDSEKKNVTALIVELRELDEKAAA